MVNLFVPSCFPGMVLEGLLLRMLALPVGFIPLKCMVFLETCLSLLCGARSMCLFRLGQFLLELPLLLVMDLWRRSQGKRAVFQFI